MAINIALDGPSAAGKSTIAKRLAKQLNYVHLDTGAMYRCVAYKALHTGVDLKDEAAVCKMIEETVIDMKSDGSIFLDGKAITNEIRTDEISMAASHVSAHKQVRALLVAQQQKIAENKGYIMDGRDIGTVVLPHAELKVFMTASAEARANRRHLENLSKGFESDLSQIIEEIRQRDWQDTHREHSPLKKAEDAVVLDTSDMSIDEVVKKIEELLPL
ncbi:MAG: (d)CMP kinase [Erysipelotrichaceae bacterium]|nr:(d)CMP kinase [Erysipelotrichaceae bacterium]